MNTALLLTLLFDGDGEASDVFAGPFRSVAVDNWQPGARAVNNNQPEAISVDNWQPGASAGANI